MSQDASAQSHASDASQQAADTQQSQATSSAQQSSADSVSQQNTNTQTAQQQPQAQDTSDESSQTERVVPAATEYKLPKGVPAEFGEFANANGFTQEQVDASLQQFGKVLASHDASTRTAMHQAGINQLEQWGDKKDENLAVIRQGLAFHDPNGELTKVLNDTGYGNSPVVLNFLLSLGTKLKEGGFIKGRAQSTKPARTSMAHRMYPNDVPKQ